MKSFSAVQVVGAGGGGGVGGGVERTRIKSAENKNFSTENSNTHFLFVIKSAAENKENFSSMNSTTRFIFILVIKSAGPEQ